MSSSPSGRSRGIGLGDAGARADGRPPPARVRGRRPPGGSARPADGEPRVRRPVAVPGRSRTGRAPGEERLGSRPATSSGSSRRSSRVPMQDDRRLAGGHGRLGARGAAQGRRRRAPSTRWPSRSAGHRRPDAPIVEWEGGRYRVDVAAAESDRIQRIRQKQGGYVLDAAVQLHSTARSLSVSSLVLEDVTRASAALSRIQLLLPRKDAGEPVRSGARRRRESSRSARHRRALDPRARADHTAARHAVGRGRSPSISSRRPTSSWGKC